MKSVNSEQTYDDLFAAIALKRQELIDTGMTYGLTHKKTLKCSKQLDKLLNLGKEGYNEPLDLTLTG